LVALGVTAGCSAVTRDIDEFLPAVRTAEGEGEGSTEGEGEGSAEDEGEGEGSAEGEGEGEGSAEGEGEGEGAAEGEGEGAPLSPPVCRASSAHFCVESGAPEVGAMPTPAPASARFLLVPGG